MNDTTTLYNGRWLALRQRGSWEYVERTNPGGAAVVVAVTPLDEVLFVEQFRVPIQRKTLEFPAGLIGDENAAEASIETAARELEEETGWRAGHIRYVQGGPSSAGMSTEHMHFFRAGQLERVGRGGGVGGENIVVHAVPIVDAAAFVARCAASAYAIDPKVYAGLYFLRCNADGSVLPAHWWR
jgi:ADP-ribose pyrophosphatase